MAKPQGVSRPRSSCEACASCSAQRRHAIVQGPCTFFILNESNTASPSKRAGKLGGRCRRCIEARIKDPTYYGTSFTQYWACQWIARKQPTRASAKNDCARRTKLPYWGS